ncbi:outer membrane protein assembly factor BamB family protein [Haloarcula laminariae]|uniref:outer membrane protein assembly factor BamB family protein n=1 Tax=Haloarcula laminariae TaxID=2961577 RepID=UPI002405EF69|nr:PQQ-binding-like beta-propeller repeat protein [Halomicroarcula sp. FL173]
MPRCTRRTWLRIAGVVGATSIAGCSSSETTDPGGDEPTTETGSTAEPAGTGEWRQFQFDDGNSGYAPDNVGPTGDIETRWRVDADAGSGSYAIYGGPAVADGTVYIGSEQLFAIDTTDGSTMWTFNPGRRSGIDASPVVSGGTVYVGSWRNPTSGAVHAIDAEDGSELWRFPTGDYVNAAPTVVDGTAYVGSKDGNVYAVSGPTAAEQTRTDTETANRPQRAGLEWSFETDGQIRAAPAVVDGTVYFGSSDDRLYAVDTADGTEQWATNVGGNVETSPTVVDGTIYLGSGYSGPMYALDAADGTEQWRYEEAVTSVTSPVVTDDAVFIAGEENTVVSLNRTNGDENWSQQLGDEDGVAASMAATENVIYVPSDGGGLQALSTDDGSVLWTALNDVEAPPAVADGTVYVGTRNDKLCALSEA